MSNAFAFPSVMLFKKMKRIIISKLTTAAASFKIYAIAVTVLIMRSHPYFAKHFK